MPQLVKRISEGLQLPPGLIYRVAITSSHAYKHYTVPKHGGGARSIHHPSKELKALQRWLVRNVIGHWPVHECAVAYRRGLGTAHNASRHAGSKFLLRLDFADFFPSISAHDIRLYLQTGPAEAETWDNEDRDLFIGLVCRAGKLTIGAPTSPGMSNAICHALDSELAGLAARGDMVYTRYADDLYFSTSRPNVLEKVPNAVADILKGLQFPAGLTLNLAKTWHASRKGHRQVTGIVLTSDGQLSVGRASKRWIRGQIHRWTQLTAREKQVLRGHVAYAVSVEPDLINRLILKYGKKSIDQVTGSIT